MPNTTPLAASHQGRDGWQSVRHASQPLCSVYARDCGLRRYHATPEYDAGRHFEIFSVPPLLHISQPRQGRLPLVLISPLLYISHCHIAPQHERFEIRYMASHFWRRSRCSTGWGGTERYIEHEEMGNEWYLIEKDNSHNVSCIWMVESLRSLWGIAGHTMSCRERRALLQSRVSHQSNAGRERQSGHNNSQIDNSHLRQPASTLIPVTRIASHWTGSPRHWLIS